VTPRGARAAILHEALGVRVALDTSAWRDDLPGGRALHHDGRWLDAATGLPVQLRAWLVDEDTAARWDDRHRDALDAWVVRCAVGWTAVRIDLPRPRSGWPAPLLLPVPVPADTSPHGRDMWLPWVVAARVLRRAGFTPCAPAVLKLLARWPPSWWGPVAVPARRAELGPDALRAVESFERQAGRVVLLLEQASEGASPAEGNRPMRDTDVLDVLERMDLEADPVRALQVLCAEVRQRLRAAASGAVRPQGTSVACVGTAEAPPARWLEAVASGVGAPRIVADGRVVVAAPAADIGGTHGTLWAAWPDADQVPAEAESLLATCGRLAAARLALCAAHSGMGASTSSSAPAMVGGSAAMAAVRRHLERAARTPFPVLLLGESGVGKELAARTIHAASPRRHRRFVAVNAAALPDDLLEAELFGHARGAFTGAVGDRAGVFEEADGGTLFLDEVGDLSPRAQAKLLRVLQDGEVRRLGEAGCRRVDVRVIAATNADLEDAVAARRFRSDLYYRLAVLCVRIPPLRERRDDIPALVAHLWHDCARRAGSEARLHPAVVDRLQAHHWPGNVRELQNVLAGLAVEAPRRGVVTASALDGWALVLGDAARSEAARGAAAAQDGTVPVAASSGLLPLDDARRVFETALVRAALTRAGGRRTVAARQLGVSRQGLSKLVRRLGLEGGDARLS
jgi:DNA-binding NtrC family response regulator